MTIKKNIFLILLIALISFNCSDEPNSAGGDGGIDLGTINLLILNSNDDSLSQTSSYSHPKDVKLSSSERLLLGKIAGTDSAEINASILIQFETALADSIEEDIRNNEVTVTSAIMEFQKTYNFGDTLAPFDFTVHKVTSNWSVDFDEDSTVIFEDPDLILEKEVTDTVTSVTLNNQLLLDWLMITADTSLSGNNGLYIKPTDNTNKVLGYQALTSAFTDIPIIKVVIVNANYTDTITFISTVDLTVMKGSIPAVSIGNVAIRAGYIFNGKLFFDLSSLSKEIVVNKAELVLTIDSLETKVGSSFSNSLLAYFLFDSTNTDSVSSLSATLSRSGNTFTGNITTFVRAWIDNNNQGLLLGPGSPTSGVELFAIRGSEAATDKPLLKITYSEFKK